MSEARAKEIAFELYIADYQYGKEFSFQISRHHDELAEKAKKLGIPPNNYIQFVLKYGLEAAMRCRGTPITVEFPGKARLETHEAEEIALQILISRGVNTGPDELRRRVKKISEMLDISIEEAEDFVMQYLVVRSIGRASNSRVTSLTREGGRIADSLS
jgi:hypothetical protein